MAKMGKGYRNGRAIGPKVGICDECGADVVAIQMTTSTKGMTATSEKVCSKCGLLHAQSFQILDHYDTPYSYMLKYKSAHIEETEADNTHTIDGTNIRPYENFKQRIKYKQLKGNICTDRYFTIREEEYYYKTHEEWLEENGLTPLTHEGMDLLYEYILQIKGERPGPKSPKKKPGKLGKSAYRLQVAQSRGGRVGAMVKGNKGNWNKARYKEMAVDYAHELGLMSHQLQRVIDIIDHEKYIFKKHYKVEDIIYHICLRVRLLEMGRKGTSLMNKVRLGNMYNKKLYSLIVQTLDS